MSRLFIILILFSCSSNNPQKIQEDYSGPIIEIKNLNTFFSDSAKVRFKLKSDLYQVFTSGEEIYPDGLKMDIFSRNIDSVSAIFSANHVIKYPDENYYKAVGDVILLNINTNDELRTEELFWYPNDEKFISEKLKISEDFLDETRGAMFVYNELSNIILGKVVKDSDDYITEDNDYFNYDLI